MLRVNEIELEDLDQDVLGANAESSLLRACGDIWHEGDGPVMVRTVYKRAGKPLALILSAAYFQKVEARAGQAALLEAQIKTLREEAAENEVIDLDGSGPDLVALHADLTMRGLIDSPGLTVERAGRVATAILDQAIEYANAATVENGGDQ